MNVEGPVAHGTIELERRWKAPPERVFAAWADPEVKAQWFAGPAGWTPVERRMDFRVGGEEVAEGRFDHGLVSRFCARYHLIEAPRRLVFAYDLHLDGAWHSITLATLRVDPDGAGSHMRYTEQIVFLDGVDGSAQRAGGTRMHLDRIEAWLAGA